MITAEFISKGNCGIRLFSTFAAKHVETGGYDGSHDFTEDDDCNDGSNVVVRLVPQQQTPKITKARSHSLSYT